MKKKALYTTFLLLMLFTNIPILPTSSDLELEDQTKNEETVTSKAFSSSSYAAGSGMVSIDNTTTIDWIKQHQKPNGGYGQLENEWSHVSWTYPALNALSLLDMTRSDDYAKPSNTQLTIDWLHSLEGDGPHNSFDDGNDRKGNSGGTTPLSDFEGIYSLILLGSSLLDEGDEINYLSGHQLTYSGTFESEDLIKSLQVAWALDLLDATNRINQNDVSEFVNWLKNRQLPDGGWNRLSPDDSNEYDNVQNNKSWVTYTWYAVKLHEILDAPVASQAALLDWVASTQADNGGFALFPVNEMRDDFTGITDVYYTWCALSIFDYFHDFSRIDTQKALDFLNSLQNVDGGFGDKPGWKSRLYSTFWAISSIYLLNGSITPKLLPEPSLNPIPEDGSIRPYVWAVQQDSNQNNGYYPSEAMLFGEKHHVALLGRKDINPNYLADANEYATYYDLQTRAIMTPEGYGTSFHVNGLMDLTHRWYFFSNRNHPKPDTENYVYNWTTWRNLLDNVHDDGGYGYFPRGSIDETYYVMDDSILNNRGYFAIAGSEILAGDQIRAYPWLEKYIGLVPILAEQDAHNDFFKEIPQINSVRGVFLAPNGTWTGLVDAVEKNRVALVFMDTPRVIYGTPETVAFLKNHLDEPWNTIYDGQVSVVPVTHGSDRFGIPNNDYERPTWNPASGVHFSPNFNGIVIKIKSRAQSLDFISFDGSPNITNMTFVASGRKEISDYYWINLQSPSNGTHTISVQYTHDNGSQLWYEVTFDYYSDQILDNGAPPIVTVLNPNGGEVWKGIQTIQWTASDPDGDSLSYNLYYRNSGSNWAVLATGLSQMSFEWDTTQIPDGTEYFIRVTANDGYYFREDISDASFTIRNHELPTPPPEEEEDNGDPPKVKILSPNGGEIWAGVQTIRWSGSDPDGDSLRYTVYYRNSAGNWIKLDDGLSKTSYKWNTTQIPDGLEYLIKIKVNDGHFTREDISNSPFAIANQQPPIVILLNPNGGETWAGMQTIRWNASDPNGDSLTYTIYYRDGGAMWIKIADGLTTPSFDWNTTRIPDGFGYLIKIKGFDGHFMDVDISDSPFTIANLVPVSSTSRQGEPPTITVLTPNGREVLTGIQAIRWSANDLDGDLLNFTIYYGNEKIDWTPLAAGLTNTSLKWDTTLIQDGSEYLIKIKVTDGYFIREDVSNSPFSINNSAAKQLLNVTVLSPNGGETWAGIQTIRWTDSNLDENSIAYSVYYGNNRTNGWIELATGLKNTSLDWNTTQVTDGPYIIKVTVKYGTFSYSDISNSPFTVANPPGESSPSLWERIRYMQLRVEPLLALGASFLLIYLYRKRHKEVIS